MSGNEGLRAQLMADVSIPMGPNAVGDWAEVAGRRRAMALLLLNRVEAEEAAVERVKALANEWARNDLGTDRLCANELTAAIDGESHRDGCGRSRRRTSASSGSRTMPMSSADRRSHKIRLPQVGVLGRGNKRCPAATPGPLRDPHQAVPSIAAISGTGTCAESLLGQEGSVGRVAGARNAARVGMGLGDVGDADRLSGPRNEGTR